MIDLLPYIIFTLGGLCAGIATGLAGASAIMVMVPFLVIFLKIDIYIAIGISLFTDVFISLVAAYFYKKKRHVRLRSALVILLASIFGIALGSYISFYIPSKDLSGLTGIGIFIIGILMIYERNKQHVASKKFLERFNNSTRIKLITLILMGLIIGFISGIFGAGGGIMLLLALVFLLGYPIHVAIGTSILIMAFMALFGAGFHFYYKPFSEWFLLLFAAGGGFIGARYSSIIANLTSERKLKIIIGILFLILSVGLLLEAYVF